MAAGAEQERRFGAGKLPAPVLAELLSRFAGGDDPRLLVPPGIGEDAAVIDFGDRCLVAKTDPITFATDRIGWYAVHVNANDIAAMGAVPKWFLASVIVPEALATKALFEQVLGQIHEACRELGVTVAGGHTEVSFGMDRPLVVGQMLGEVRRDGVVRSSGLRPGDALLLTKGMAIEATAIIAAEKRDELRSRGWTEADLDRCAGYLDDPGISVVADARTALAAGGVHAMHDPTEGGVATGLAEMAGASEVGLEIDGGALPVSPESRHLCAEFGLDPFGVISSGALLIGCDPEAAGEVIAVLQGQGIACARIGTAREPGFGLRLRQPDGALVELPRFEVDEITRLFA